MTTYKTIRGTQEELEDLFDNATVFSVRYYNRLKRKGDTWDITLRFTDRDGLEKRIRRASTAKGLLSIEKEYSRSSKDIEK